MIIFLPFEKSLVILSINISLKGSKFSFFNLNSNKGGKKCCQLNIDVSYDILLSNDFSFKYLAASNNSIIVEFFNINLSIILSFSLKTFHLILMWYSMV